MLAYIFGCVECLTEGICDLKKDPPRSTLLLCVVLPTQRSLFNLSHVSQSRAGKHAPQRSLQILNQMKV